MSDRVAIVGVGCSDVRSTTPGVSYKELTFDAATRAYADAGVDVREDVQSFVSVSEDYWEGTSIFDEYVPDQLGAAQRPVHTIGGEGIQGLLAAYMQIRTGFFDCVVVEAHSKYSNVLTPNRVLAFGLDPVLNRPLGLNPHFVAGLEMRRYLHESGATPEQCAAVVVKNRRNAVDNPYGAHAGALGLEDVLAASPVAEPLRRLDCSPGSDGAVVLVLASEERARSLGGKPVRTQKIEIGGAWLDEVAYFWEDTAPLLREVLAEDGPLCLRRLTGEPGDIAAMARWLSDPRVLAYYEGRDQSFDEARVRRVFLEETIAKGETPCLIIHGDLPIGYLQLYPVPDEEAQEYGLGQKTGVFGLDLFIGLPDRWGTGLGTEAVRLALTHLFGQAGARTVIVDPHVDNRRAIRCYEKAGFRAAKTLPAHESHEGRLVDCLLMRAEAARQGQPSRKG